MNKTEREAAFECIKTVRGNHLLSLSYTNSGEREKCKRKGDIFFRFVFKEPVGLRK